MMMNIILHLIIKKIKQTEKFLKKELIMNLIKITIKQKVMIKLKGYYQKIQFIKKELKLIICKIILINLKINDILIHKLI